MKKQLVPQKRMIFVCTNSRPDGEGRPACALRGSEKFCEQLKEEVKKRGLKGKVRALKSGCMDLCELGPNIMVFPENLLYSGVTAEDIPALIDEYLR